MRPLCTTVFPVRFTDKIRKLNQLNRANAIKAAIVAGALDAVPALADIVFGQLTDRRIDLATLVNDDAALAEHVRNNVAGTFHVCGTCRMGADDPDAVVDNARPRSRHRRAARGRCVDHAGDHARQHQYPHHHAGREDRRRPWRV